MKKYFILFSLSLVFLFVLPTLTHADYACVGGQCTAISGYGPYSTATCNNSCVAGSPIPVRYKCTGNSCELDPTGQGAYTVSNCYNACATLPPVNNGSNGGTGTITIAPVDGVSCNFSGSSSNYLQNDVKGLSFPDPQTGVQPEVPINPLWYATTDAAQKLAACTGGTVVMVPQNLLGGTYNPDQAYIKLPNGEMVNAGYALDRYFGYGGNLSQNAYTNWVTDMTGAKGSFSNGAAINPSGSGITTGGNQTTPVVVTNASTAQQATTNYVSNMIATYKKQLADLQGQLSQYVPPSPATTNSSTSGSTSCIPLTSDLQKGDSGTAVTYLTGVLAGEGLLPQSQSTFDDAVYQAVVAYQEKYADQILTPLGLTAGTGYVGSSTRAFINGKASCNTSSPGGATTNGNILVQPSSITLSVGSAYQFLAWQNSTTGGSLSAITTQASWISSNPAVAKMVTFNPYAASADHSGQVMAVSKGTATIAVTYNGMTSIVTITVQ